MERRMRQTQFTKREILDLANDPRNNPYDGGLHDPAPLSSALAELKRLRVVGAGAPLEYEFEGKDHLRFKLRGTWREAYYECYEAAPGIYFFFHMHDTSVPPPQMTAMCVDTNTGLVTVNNAQIGNDEYTPRDVSSQISFGAMDTGGAIPAGRHQFTDDFVGRVAAWKVGGIWLTHHYINPQFFLNEILGVDANSVFLTIAEPARYVKIAENIYVFSWREMAGPGIMGMDVMDWSKMQSVGMFYGISEVDRLECYSFTRRAGKWLSVEDRKKIHREGIYSVVGNL
jgi:hypothetical protein